MNRKITEISRRELYEQVWTEPMSTLAKKYCISDVGLAKICKRNGIPRPGRGYWARIQARQRVQRTPLPHKDIEKIIQIQANPHNIHNPEMKEIFNKVIPVMAQLDKRIAVAGTLRNPHPSVRKSAEILKSSEPDVRGIIEPSEEGCLDIWVSPKNLSRALRIMDALVKALECQGYEVSVSDNGTKVRIMDVSLGIRISEALKHKRLEARNHDLNGYYRFGYDRYDAIPSVTGELCLSIQDADFYMGGICRQNWKDGESQRVEDCLRSFVSGLLKAATLKQEHIRQKREREKEALERYRSAGEARRDTR
jgi:hypothetical protein